MGILDLSKEVYNLARGINNIPISEKVLDLQQLAMNLMQDNDRLRTENIGLQAQLRTVGKVVVSYGVYWERQEGGKLDGPFSAHEWDHNRKLVRLIHSSVGMYSGVNEPSHNFYCTSCKGVFLIPVKFFDADKVLNADQLPKYKGRSSS